LTLASREAALDPRMLMTMLGHSEATLLQATPVTWQMLLTAGWNGQGNLVALCGGESLRTELSGKLLTRVGALWNMYGPTETTIWSCCRRVTSVSDERGPVESIGAPIANTLVYILDNQQRPVPLGVIGELHIGGVGVARGYLHRPDVTAERFLQDPFSADSGARIYRTGDLGRWRADGTIEFVGRNDHQVKIRGFRIELEEIETKLAACAGVREAVVIAREEDGPEKRLVAYYTAAEELHISVEALKNHVSLTLPDYMVPAAYVRLPKLPLTENGKLDRKALPAPGDEAYVRRGYEPPEGPIEEALAATWRQVLQVQRVGRQDSFFELGGHSLLAMKLIDPLARTLGVQLALMVVFQYPILQQMARFIEQRSTYSCLPAVPDPEQGIPGASVEGFV
jgi:acyl-CoA synthetase (AMP-forming)/AMP-acid ligase II